MLQKIVLVEMLHCVINCILQYSFLTYFLQKFKCTENENVNKIILTIIIFMIDVCFSKGKLLKH